MVCARQVNIACVNNAQSTDQHMVELDEWWDQPPTLGPGTHPALTRRTVCIGHRRGDVSESRMALG